MCVCQLELFDLLPREDLLWSLRLAGLGEARVAHMLRSLPRQAALFVANGKGMGATGTTNAVTKPADEARAQEMMTL